MTVSASELIARIEAREASIGVVGLGYVGLPVALSFAEAGYRVLGVDLDRGRVRAVQAGRSFLNELPHERIAHARSRGMLRAATSFEQLVGADAVLICVPTPLNDGTPDLSRVIAAGQALAKVVKPGSIVVLESTTYPGTTEEILCPLLEASGLVVGDQIFVAFSPERIDPGNPIYAFEDIPKIVGGVTEGSTAVAAALYKHVVPKVIAVSGPKEAELAKLIENTFRHVNIGLINELAVYAHEMDIDIWEAIEAAATKPFGYLPFWPGPGWGGHCIPLDPAYLSWRVRRDRAHEIRFVELAHKVNSEMPRYVVERVALLLNDHGKPLRGARILGVGAAYKGGTEDIRESASLKVLTMLAARGAEILYHDPLVAQVEVAGLKLGSVPLEPQVLKQQDLVVALVRQSEVEWNTIARHSRLVLDCCNALARKNSHIARL